MEMPITLREAFTEYEHSFLTPRSKVSMASAFRRLFEQTEAAFSAVGKDPHPMPDRLDFLAVDETARWG